MQGMGNGFQQYIADDDTMSYTSMRDRVGTLFEGEIQRKTGTLSSQKLFAVLIQDDYNFYFTDVKNIPKNRPEFISPFTQELNFDQSVRSIGALAANWVAIDLRKCEIIPSKKESKIFKIEIPEPDSNLKKP